MVRTVILDRIVLRCFKTSAAVIGVGLVTVLLTSPVHGEPGSAQQPSDSGSPERPTEERTSSRPQPVEVAPATARERAKHAFAAGLGLAREGKYLEAKDRFLEAHALDPHPIVAYNAALACLALGERDEAARLLARALADDAGKLSVAERALVEAVRDTLPPPEQAPSERAAPPMAPKAPPGEAQRLEPGVRSPQPSRLASPPTRREAARSGASNEIDATSRARSRTGYVVGAVGLALLTSAGVVYLWNDERHDDWLGENAALKAEESDLLGAGEVPSQNAELRHRAGMNDELLASIKTVDVIGGVVLATGLLGLGTGIYLIATKSRSNVEVAIGRRLGLRYRF